MRKKFFYLLLLVLFGLTSCVANKSNDKSTAAPSTPPAPKASKTSSVQKVAVVSFAVNNYGTIFGQGSIDPSLIQKSMGDMLTGTEDILKRRWQVKPASSFVGNSSYFDLSTGKLKHGLSSPVIGGRSIPTFTLNRKELVKGTIDPKIAKQLCNVLAVDAVVLYYSEWTLDSGKFVPTIKALTKNCVSMYDSKGKKLFFQRKDVRGTKTIGSAYSGTHINADTIDNWVEASLTGIETIFSKAKI